MRDDERRPNRLRRYVSARFFDTKVTMCSPLPPQQVASAIAAGLKPQGLRSALGSALGQGGIYGWLDNYRFSLSDRSAIGQPFSQAVRPGYGATLAGGLFEAPDGSTVLEGRLAGMQVVGVILCGIWLFSGFFIFIFGWGAIDPRISTPPIPPWLVLVPIGLDLFGLLIIEVNHANRMRHWAAIKEWLLVTAQLALQE